MATLAPAIPQAAQKGVISDVEVVFFAAHKRVINKWDEIVEGLAATLEVDFSQLSRGVITAPFSTLLVRSTVSLDTTRLLKLRGRTVAGVLVLDARLPGAVGDSPPLWEVCMG